MTTKYPNLPNIEFVSSCCCFPIDHSRKPLPEIHKPGNTLEGNTFAEHNKYRLTLKHNGSVFSSRYYYGYNLNAEAVAAGSKDETVVLTHLLKCAADNKGESGKYELNISVLADNKEYDLGVVLPDGSILETITLEK